MKIILSLLVFLIIFFLIYASVLIGHRFGKWQIHNNPHHKLGLLGIAEGAVFALLGLLIAFNFSGAYDRFEQRKMQIIEETNTIHNAYLLLDLLNPKFKPVLSTDFKEYIQSRIAIYKNLNIINYSIVETRINHTRQLQLKIWNQSIDALKESNNDAANNALPDALLAMFAATNTQFAISYIHPPLTIMFLLMALSILSGFLTGYNMARKKLKNQVHIFSYIVITSLTLYLIFDLELPRLGLIRVTPFDSQLSDVNKI